MYLADTLSRAFPPDVVEEEIKRTIELENYIRLMSKTALVSDRKLAKIKGKSTRDESMQILTSHIRGGWPSNKAKIPREIRDGVNMTASLSHRGLAL